jgi:hypothetical protein
MRTVKVHVVANAARRGGLMLEARQVEPRLAGEVHLWCVSNRGNGARWSVKKRP